MICCALSNIGDGNVLGSGTERERSVITRTIYHLDTRLKCRTELKLGHYVKLLKGKVQHFGKSTFSSSF